MLPSPVSPVATLSSPSLLESPSQKRVCLSLFLSSSSVRVSSISPTAHVRSELKFAGSTRSTLHEGPRSFANLSKPSLPPSLPSLTTGLGHIVSCLLHPLFQPMSPPCPSAKCVADDRPTDRDNRVSPLPALWVDAVHPTWPEFGGGRAGCVAVEPNWKGAPPGLGVLYGLYGRNVSENKTCQGRL